MNKSLLNRLTRLEAQQPGALIAECDNLLTGETKVAPIRDFLPDFENWRLNRIVEGGSLEELDELLNTFKSVVNDG